MNWRHLQAFLWLRWRLSRNQYRRAGAVNAFLMLVATVGALLTVVPLFIGSIVLGNYLIPKAEPAYLMYAWDALIVGFLFFWGVGLMTELQRSDSLALSKFLHLPVSVNGAFLINYVSSLFRLSLFVFTPMMLGFSLALVATKGVLLLPVLPLLAAFLLMITALTYQLQGWLAALMSNPRRRRTVIMVMTASFILIFQLPNLVNIMQPWGGRTLRQTDGTKALSAEMVRLNQGLQAHEYDVNEFQRRLAEAMQKHKAAQGLADRATLQSWERTARLANMVLPIGWLPLGVMDAAEGNIWPALLGLSGLTLIGTASLWRAYRSTVRQFQGQATGRAARPIVAAASASAAVAARAGGRKAGARILEARLPGVSEPVAAVALGGFRSLSRAPEAKMMLFSLLLMSAFFGSMLWKGRGAVGESIRPLVPIGGMGFVLLGMLQLIGNQFGFDRDGFRVFVLSSAPRRDILLGKNLAFAPLVLGMSALLLVTVQAVSPLRLDHLAAMVPQFVSMFLLFCLFANLLSIYAPTFVAAGSLKPTSPKLTTVLLQVVMVTILFPLMQGLTLLPLGGELLLRFLGRGSNIPVCLLLSLVECAAVVVVYGLLLTGQGALLQAREQRILEAVTNRGP